MKLAIRPDIHGDGFHVWAMLNDDFDGEPQDRGESFIIGSGPTPDIARAKARIELATAIVESEALEP